MRQARVGIVAVSLALAAVIGTPAVVGGGQLNDASITVQKTVNGTAPSGFTVEVTCTIVDLDTVSATLTFLADGTPNTTSDPIFQSVNGAWTADVGQPPGDATCSVTETVSAGAADVSWTCTHESTLENGLTGGECAAPNGTGIGPVQFTFTTGASVVDQTATVVFTNTFVAVPVVNVAPTGLTG